MNTPERSGNSEHTPDSARCAPALGIAIRNQTNTKASPDRWFIATITGLQSLKCSGVSGYGSTEEEAVRKLRRKVFQYLDFIHSYEPSE